MKNKNRSLQIKKMCLLESQIFDCTYSSTVGLNKIFDITKDWISHAENEVKEVSQSMQQKDKKMETEG